MAKPIKTLELHYQMIQFLIIANTAFGVPVVRRSNRPQLLYPQMPP